MGQKLCTCSEWGQEVSFGFVKSLGQILFERKVVGLPWTCLVLSTASVSAGLSSTSIAIPNGS